MSILEEKKYDQCSRSTDTVENEKPVLKSDINWYITLIINNRKSKILRLFLNYYFGLKINVWFSKEIFNNNKERLNIVFQSFYFTSNTT